MSETMNAMLSRRSCRKYKSDMIPKAVLEEILKAGTYALENHRGEKADRLNPGMEGVLHCECGPLPSGIYIRA